MESNITSIKTSHNSIATVSESITTTNENITKANEINKANDLDNSQKLNKLESPDILEKDTLFDNQKGKELSKAIEVISTFIEPQIRNVNFTQDEGSGKTVVKVFDTQSKELIKQFPSEEVLALAEKIRGLQDEVASKTGILIDDKV